MTKRKRIEYYTLRRIEGETFSKWVTRVQQYLADDSNFEQTDDENYHDRQFRRWSSPEPDQLCREEPDGCFLLWMLLKEKLSKNVSKLNEEQKARLRKWCDGFRFYYENMGHWRDLDPKAKDLSFAGSGHLDDVRNFIRKRRKKLRMVDFDDVKLEDYEATKPFVVWVFSLKSKHQLTIAIKKSKLLSGDVTNIARFGKLILHGYAIHGTDLSFMTIYFHNTPSIFAKLSQKEKCLPYGCKYSDADVNISPDSYAETGDYELRNVSKEKAKGEDLHSSFKKVEKMIAPLSEKITEIDSRNTREKARLKRKIERERPHAIRGKKILQSVSKGGLANKEKREETKKSCRADLLTYMSENGVPPYGKGKISLTAGREKIARKHKISRRTAEKYTKDLF